MRTRCAARSVSRHREDPEADAGTEARTNPQITAKSTASTRMARHRTCEDPPVPALSEIITVLEQAYPPALAESWDAVGLVCGDPAEPVTRVLFCVDPVTETVDEAAELGAQLIVAHHPLLLRGVHGVPADTAKGALVHRMIRAG